MEHDNWSDESEAEVADQREPHQTSKQLQENGTVTTYSSFLPAPEREEISRPQTNTDDHRETNLK